VARPPSMVSNPNASGASGAPVVCIPTVLALVVIVAALAVAELFELSD